MKNLKQTKNNQGWLVVAEATLDQYRKEAERELEILRRQWIEDKQELLGYIIEIEDDFDPCLYDCVEHPEDQELFEGFKMYSFQELNMNAFKHENLQDLMEDIEREAFYEGLEFKLEGPEDLKHHLANYTGAYKVHDLFMLDHGQIKFSNTSFNVRFDSGQVGMITEAEDVYVDIEDFIEELNHYMNPHFKTLTIKNQVGVEIYQETFRADELEDTHDLVEYIENETDLVERYAENRYCKEIEKENEKIREENMNEISKRIDELHEERGSILKLILEGFQIDIKTRNQHLERNVEWLNEINIEHTEKLLEVYEIRQEAMNQNILKHISFMEMIQEGLNNEAIELFESYEINQTKINKEKLNEVKQKAFKIIIEQELTRLQKAFLKNLIDRQEREVEELEKLEKISIEEDLENIEQNMNIIKIKKNRRGGHLQVYQSDGVRYVSHKDEFEALEAIMLRIDEAHEYNLEEKERALDELIDLIEYKGEEMKRNQSLKALKNFSIKDIERLIGKGRR